MQLIFVKNHLGVHGIGARRHLTGGRPSNAIVAAGIQYGSCGKTLDRTGRLLESGIQPQAWRFRQGRRQAFGVAVCFRLVKGKSSQGDGSFPTLIFGRSAPEGYVGAPRAIPVRYGQTSVAGGQ